MNDTALIRSYLEHELSMTMAETATMDELRESLAQRVNDLIDADFERLVRMLYRIDVNENKLKRLLNENQGPTGELIADLIIERQIEKAKTREQFRQSAEDPEEEKW